MWICLRLLNLLKFNNALNIEPPIQLSVLYKITNSLNTGLKFLMHLTFVKFDFAFVRTLLQTEFVISITGLYNVQGRGIKSSIPILYKWLTPLIKEIRAHVLR